MEYQIFIKNLPPKRVLQKTVLKILKQSLRAVPAKTAVHRVNHEKSKVLDKYP